MNRIHLCLFVVTAFASLSAHADIVRWDNGQVIPGTQGIEPGPGVVLEFRNLQFAALDGLDLRAGQFNQSNLTSARFDHSDLRSSGFIGTNFTSASFVSAELTGVAIGAAKLINADFTAATLTSADLRTNLTNTILTGAVIDFANFRDTTNLGFTALQLYSTASYQAKSLRGLNLAGNDLTGWDFSGQDLTGAQFSTEFGVGQAAILANTDFSGAIVQGANMNATTQAGFTKPQMYSTASYQSKNLRGVQFARNNFATADFSAQDLSHANFFGTELSSVNFRDANLSGAYFHSAGLVGADFTGADVSRANFTRTGNGGLSGDQLYSTASYHAKVLDGISLFGNGLQGADLRGQSLRGASLGRAQMQFATLQAANLTGADFESANLYGADFSGAIVTEASFSAGSGDELTKEQLYATASYANKDLQGIRFYFGSDLEGWNLSGQNLRKSHFHSAVLVDANLTNADLTDAYLYQATLGNALLEGALIAGANLSDTDRFNPFSKEQLYSTASYQSGNLARIGLAENDLSGWDFTGQDLTQAAFYSSNVTNANFADAIIEGAAFSYSGVTKEQIYETASYVHRNLRRVSLGGANLEAADFTNQDLSGASFDRAALANADFTGANVAGANFDWATSNGFTKEQLYSTASYQQRSLGALSLFFCDLRDWSFAGQDLRKAYLIGSNTLNTDFSFADMRGAHVSDLNFLSVNTIEYSGRILGLTLGEGERLVVRNFVADAQMSSPAIPVPVSVFDEMTVGDSGTLELRFDADPWNSLISFEAGIPVQLGGALELTFAPGVDVHSQIGRTFQAFDWTGVSPTGTFSIASIYPWDVSELYTTGAVTLLLPGDTNGDHAVDLEDLNAVRNNFGGQGDGDTNSDGVVDLTDLNNVRNFFGASTPQPVPEPSSVALAIGGFGLLLLARRQRRPHAVRDFKEPIVDAQA